MSFSLKFKQQHYNKRKKYLASVKILSGCVDCGITTPDEILTFDHVRGEKKFCIGSRWDVGIKRLEEEITKCEVVCQNCHAKRTKKRLEEKESNLPPFISFPKIPRLSREIIITEKIDGTNGIVWVDGDFDVWAGSKNRWLNCEDDNFGFAKWVEEHKEDFIETGEGVYRGEWMGKGIQRCYGLEEKRFYLFNTQKFNESNDRPECCYVVPILYKGNFNTDICDNTITNLRMFGSKAISGFMNPEGIIIFHTASGQLFKKTIENDEKGKEQ